ncbi:MAG: hypothetical protein M3Q03_10925 [Chloroflexota bacterium]|nr:hypothetical protein [Chloroflexota bacterium]
MYTSEHLSIEGYRGEQVPNEFLRQDSDAHHVAILLPGMGYTCDMPLFYYAEMLLLDAGADILRVEYRYNRRPDFRDLPAPVRLNWLLADASAAYQAALVQRQYSGGITLIGKSLGTLAMGHLLSNHPQPGPMRAVWLTPMPREDVLRDQMRRCGGPSLVAIGTADPHFDPMYLQEIRSTTQCQAVVIDDGDHSLDIPGDVIASVRAVERVTREVGAFLGM